jgi:drug/metabolite transporter (DMT)-like permease
MVSLILQIIFSTAFGLIMKDAQTRGRNLLAVGAVNYTVAAITAALVVLRDGNFEWSIATLIVGIFGGITYVVSYFLLIPSIRLSGISVTIAVVRVSVLVPILFSIFYWNEKPNLYQIVGVILVCLSLPLLSNKPNNSSHENKSKVASLLLIFALFVFTGGCGLSAKAFYEFSPGSQRLIFLTFLFGTAAAIGILALIFQSIMGEKHEKNALSASSPPGIRDIVPGIFLGTSNIVGNHFLLLALKGLPGMIVFPISSSMGVILTTLVAMTVWREKLPGPAVAGIVTAVIAVVLINLK